MRPANRPISLSLQPLSWDHYASMKPLFTIHAGEFLVASYIEQKFKDYLVWLPSRDSGVDLLLTD